MPIAATFTVKPDEAGGRLDLFVLAQCEGTTRALIRDAIASGGIAINGKSAPKGARLRPGDIVEVVDLPTEKENRVQPSPAVAGIIKQRIVYEDESFIAFDKPAGMPVQPLSSREDGTLAGGAVAIFPPLAGVGDEPLIAGAIHRIDAPTSGLVIFAKNNSVFSSMRALFAAREVEKKYIALVRGKVDNPSSVTCNLAHAPHLSYCRMVAYDSLSAGERKRSRPLFAATSFAPLSKIKGGTLLIITISTGVTHQIRAQLAMAGYPIVGDTLYGERLVEDGNLHLHSLSATFRHPATGKMITIETPLPPWARCM